MEILFSILCYSLYPEIILWLIFKSIYLTKCPLIATIRQMKPLAILGLFTLLLCCSRNEEEKEARPLTNAEKIARDVQKKFGAFDAVYHFEDDSLVVLYTYRPEANKSREVKAVIDKTLNMEGEEMIPNFANPAYRYQWETSTESISLQGVYKDSASYVNVWVLTK